MDCLCHVPLSQQLYAQLKTLLTLQINDRTVSLKVGHSMDIMGSHCHLPLNNVEGVGSVPPPLSQCVHYDNIGRTL